VHDWQWEHVVMSPFAPALAAPRVTEFLTGIAGADPFLRDHCRLVLLGEVASVAVPHPDYEALPGAPCQYRELLGCIWHESLAAADWLAVLCEAVLPPLLHALYRYGTVFSPHGENAILVHRLLAPRFAKICLNRNRLLTDGYANRPERPHAATFGTVRYALHEVAVP
jgi:siderophore synthetase component